MEHTLRGVPPATPHLHAAPQRPRREQQLQRAVCRARPLLDIRGSVSQALRSVHPGWFCPALAQYSQHCRPGLRGTRLWAGRRRLLDSWVCLDQSLDIPSLSFLSVKLSKHSTSNCPVQLEISRGKV